MGTIKNGQSRENDSIGYTRRRKSKQKQNTICDGYKYTQINKKVTKFNPEIVET